MGFWTQGHHCHLVFAKKHLAVLPSVADVFQLAVVHVGHGEDEKVLVRIHALPKLFYQALFQFKPFLAVLVKETNTKKRRDDERRIQRPCGLISLSPLVAQLHQAGRRKGKAVYSQGPPSASSLVFLSLEIPSHISYYLMNQVVLRSSQAKLQIRVGILRRGGRARSCP